MEPEWWTRGSPLHLRSPGLPGAEGASDATSWENDMFKGGLLWLLGIPLPIILILWFLGYLH